jgi:ABC-type branched-subunit amino acid transport system substrate-binding protein
MGDNVYFVYPDYSYGQSAREVSIPMIESQGGTVVGESAVPLGTEEYSTVIDSINQADADWVMMVLNTNVPAFLTQAGNRGVEKPLVSNFLTSDIIGQLTQRQYDNLPELYRGALRYTREIDTEANQLFVSSFTERYDKQPTYAHETGYMTGQLALNTLHEAKDLETDSIISAAEGLKFDAPRGEYPIRECDHQGNPPVYTAEVTGIDQETGLGTNEIIERHDSSEFITPCEDRTCSFD